MSELTRNISLATNTSLIPNTSLSPAQVDEDDAALLKGKHAGHEVKHLYMLLILILAMIVSQVLLVFWKTRYPKSYIHWSMITMYIVPFCISAYRHWWRFVTIWVIISLITISLVWKPLTSPDFSNSGSTIPRKLYKWFFILYSLSSVIAAIGYTVLLLTFFGVNVLLNIDPMYPIGFGIMSLFYGTYYGVLTRDFTDFLVDKLAARLGYYNPASELPSRLLNDNICAICGLTHNNGEKIDINGLGKEDFWMVAPKEDQMDGSIHSCEEAQELIEEVNIKNDNSEYKERVFVLTCGHKFHEYCIYGWCLVGKRQICPFCNEKVDLGKLFSALPFQRPHYLYGHLLDIIRYFFAWQPLIFFLVHILDYELGLN